MKKIGMLGYGILLMCMTACSHADITMKTDKVEFVEFYLSGTEADEPILIDWGDGSVNEYAGGGKIEHKYAVQESYVIKITGKIRLLDCYNTRSYDCKLLSLDASGNTILKVLKCDGTGVNSLNVANCTSLYELRCGSNNFTSLDVSKNPALEEVDCGGNKLIFLDVSKNLVLRELKCAANLLTSLDVSKIQTLELLWCFSNQLSILDVSNNKNLSNLNCRKNQLKNIDVRSNPKLNSLDCSENSLMELDIRRNPNLSHVHCADNNLSASALNQIYENLPKPPAPYSAQDPLGLFTIAGSYTLDIRNNPGTVASNRDIAKNKGWEVLEYER